MTQSLSSVTDQLDRSYLDTVEKGHNCPGFDLWDVLASDGKRYLIAGDYIGGVELRLFFPAQLEVVSATKLGPNPDVKIWEAL